MGLLSILLGAQVFASSLCGTDGQVIDTEKYRFAIVGNTRPKDLKVDSLAGRLGPSKGVTKTILKDIKSTKPECVVFLGDVVKNGSVKEWKKFEKDQRSLLGDIPVQPVIGDHEAIKDSKYNNTRNVFPNMGTDIGYNRVGSWSYLDIKTKGFNWRILILDANKDALTSRWNEQMLWIDEVVKGDIDGMFIFLHQPWYNLAGASPKMNHSGQPEELLTYLENTLDMLTLRGVFFAGGHANQVILPNGAYGAVHVGAGGGGAPAEDLYLYQEGFDHGMTQKISLEPVFIESILKQVERWHGQTPLSPLALDKAYNTGTYKGFPGLIDGVEFPVQGWWELQLEGNKSKIVYHHHFINSSVEELYELHYSEKRGWKGYTN